MNEAFNNIVKYARATKVTVNLSKDNRNFHLTIQDNGVGFDPLSFLQSDIDRLRLWTE